MSFLDLEAGGAPAGRRQQDSTQALAAGVFQINTAVSTFKRLTQSLGTAKDTPALRERLHKTRLHIGQLAKETGSKLKAASDHDHNKPAHGNKKLSDAKLAKDFQAVLVDFQNAQKVAQEREKMFAPFVPEDQASQYSAEVKSAPEEKQQQIYAAQRSQDFVLLENEVVFNEAVIEEREQGIREIHQQIGEVNEIFKDLAVLVHEQGYQIDDIDNNLQGAEAATEQSNRQLAKAAASQKSGNTMTCLILVIVAMAVLVLLLFLTR